MSRRKTSRPSKKIDPRLVRINDALDDACTYGAQYGGVDLAYAIEQIVTVGINDAELPRVQKIIALLWADNAEPQFSDEEIRREKMLAIAEDLHRSHCSCCAKKMRAA